MNHIENKYLGYDELIHEFGEDAIESKYCQLRDELASFIEIAGVKDSVRIEDTCLMHMVLDYFSDVSRLKCFHKIEYINEIKVISYESYWMQRRKPIQIISNERQDDKITFINEKFVFSRLAKFLAGNEMEVGLVEDKQKKLMNFFDTLYYYLKYRDYDAKFLELMILGFKAGRLLAE